MRTHTDAEIDFYATAYIALKLDREGVPFEAFLAAPFAVCRAYGRTHPAWARQHRTTPTKLAKAFDDRDQITVAPDRGIALHRRHEEMAARFQGGEHAAFA